MATKPSNVRENQNKVNKAITPSQSTSLLPRKKDKFSWSGEEDRILVKLKTEGKKWDAISNMILGRSSEACSKRWRSNFQQHKSILGEWPAEEDHSLVILRMDGKDWNVISQEIPGRSVDACKKYFEVYHPDLFGLRSWPYTPNEDKLLAALHKQGMDFQVIETYFPDRNSVYCEKRRREHLMDLPENGVAWSQKEDDYLLALPYKTSKGIYMSSSGIFRTLKDCNRRIAELKNPTQHPTKSTIASRSYISAASRAAVSISWTDNERQRLADLHKAGKDWFEISSLFEGKYTALDCRNYWFENCWEMFHELMIDGELSTEKLKSRRWKDGEEKEEEREEEGKEEDDESNGNDEEEEEEEEEDDEDEQVYGDEPDAEGDTDDEYMASLGDNVKKG